MEPKDSKEEARERFKNLTESLTSIFYLLARDDVTIGRINTTLATSIHEEESIYSDPILESWARNCVKMLLQNKLDPHLVEVRESFMKKKETK